MSTLDKADHIATLCAGVGVDPAGIRIDGLHYEVRLATCGDYQKVCAAAKAKVDGGRPLVHPTRHAYDALAGELYLLHVCWPHLDCWGQA